MSRTLRGLSAPLVAVALMTAACSGGSGTSGGDAVAGADGVTGTEVTDTVTGTEVTATYDGTVLTGLPSTAKGASLGKGFVISADLVAADGGTVTSFDGRLCVTLAPDALSADATVSITMIENAAPGGLGPAYELDAGGVSFTSATITGTFGEADLVGTAPGAIRLASQGADGTWTAAGDATVTPTTDVSGNPTGGTVSVVVTHFSPWTMLWGWQLQPTDTDVPTGSTALLTVIGCWNEQDTFAGQWTGTPCKPDDMQYLIVASVNGIEGGNSTVGTVTVNPATDPVTHSVTYHAPSAVPSPATVAVSVVLKVAGSSTKLELISHVTVTAQPHVWIEVTTLGGSYSTTTDRGNGDLEFDNGTVSMVLDVRAQLDGPSIADGVTWGLDKSADVVVSGLVVWQDDLTYSDPAGGAIRSVLACQPQRMSLPWTDEDVMMNSGITLEYRPASKDFMLTVFGFPLRKCHEELVDFPDNPDSREVDHDDWNGHWLGPAYKVVLSPGSDPNKLKTSVSLALQPPIHVGAIIDLAGTFANARQQ
jgi:hypothetical protein